MISLKSKITQSVLLYFFINPNAQIYVNELARSLNLDSGNLSRKLIEIESFGLLKSDWRGDQRYYSLNKSFKLLKEYRKVIQQSTGLHKILQSCLRKVDGIDEAFIYGSYTQDKMDEKSDIDFMIIGSCDEISVQKALGKVEKMIGREIHSIIIGIDEYKQKITSDPFLKNVCKSRRIEVVS